MDLPDIVVRPSSGVPDVTTLDAAIEDWSVKAAPIMGSDDLDEITAVVRAHLKQLLAWISESGTGSDLVTKLELPRSRDHMLHIRCRVQCQEAACSLPAAGQATSS